METPKVLIVVGSKNDLPIMDEAGKVLGELGVGFRVEVASAHRTPKRVAELASEARANGIQAIIAGAGYAAHLAGAIAANTDLPVIGVPLEASSLQGLDALLSTVQMPSGVPVATMAIGKTGARNAGILAAQIIALTDEDLRKKLADLKAAMARESCA